MPPKKLGGIRKRVAQEVPIEPKKSKKDSIKRPQNASASSSCPLAGGIQSRVAAAQRSDEQPHEDKPLNETMKRKWGSGKLSAKDVAEVFDGASKQGAANVPNMSSLNHPQNLHRSLVAAFGHPVGAPEFFWASIPMRTGKVLHPFLLSHLWFSSLFAMMMPWWETAVRGPASAAKEYWNNVRDTDFF